MKLPKIDLQTIINKYNSATFKNTRDFDAFFIDCNNEVYDECEVVTEIKLDNLAKSEIKLLYEYLQNLLPLVTLLLNILSHSDIDTINYNMFLSQLEMMEQSIPTLLKKLNS